VFEGAAFPVHRLSIKPTGWSPSITELLDRLANEVALGVALHNHNRSSFDHQSSLIPMADYKPGSPEYEALSDRAQTAHDIARLFNENGVNVPRGGDVEKLEGRNQSTYYRVGFSYPTSLDGEVNVYGSNFILVWWSSSWQHALGGEKKWVFLEKDVMDFLRAAFVDVDVEQAMCIPTKDQKKAGETRTTLRNKRATGEEPTPKSTYQREKTQDKETGSIPALAE
jgi:hypothetical protein